MGVLMKNKVCYTGNNGKNVAVGHYDNIGVPQVFFSEKSGNKINCGLDPRYITTITTDPIAFFKWKRSDGGSDWVMYGAVSLRPLNYGSDYSHNNEHADLVDPVITTVDGTVIYVYRESGGWAYSSNPDVVINDAYHISNLFATDDDIVYNSKFLKDIVTTLKNKSADSYDTLIQPVIYSTDEREIGVWTDGKPLYQKTIYCGATGGYETTVSVNHDISNIDKFIFIFGCFGDGEPVPTVNGGSDYIRLSADSTKIYIKYKDSWETHTDISVTVQYTKTTDTPGSGIWATNGAPAKHYSTTEQVIGTWIDGSTIYERTFDIGSSLTISNNSWTRSSIPVPTNIDKIIDGNCIASDGHAIWHDMSITIDSGYFAFTCQRNGDTESMRYFTVCYTKTTS